MQTMGVPYPAGFDKEANNDLLAQANGIRLSLKMDKIETPKDAEIVALIAYLQRLGKDIKATAKK
jgi:cytochrome c oxidase cbb3-type subunit I/II